MCTIELVKKKSFLVALRLISVLSVHGVLTILVYLPFNRVVCAYRRGAKLYSLFTYKPRMITCLSNNLDNILVIQQQKDKGLSNTFDTFQ